MDVPGRSGMGVRVMAPRVEPASAARGVDVLEEGDLVDLRPVVGRRRGRAGKYDGLRIRRLDPGIGGLQQRRVRGGVRLRAPEARDVGLVPDLPVADPTAEVGY